MTLRFEPDAAVLRVLGSERAPELPRTIDSASEAIAAAPGSSWCSGQSPWLRPAPHKVCLARLDAIRVDARRGLVRAQAAASLTAVEASLRRAGWTLDLPFPAHVRLCDAFSTSPWAEVLGRRLMSLRWLSPDGALGSMTLGPTRTARAWRVDRAVPVDRADGVVVEAVLRARPTRGAIEQRWWQADSLSTALEAGAELARAAWPHAIVRVETGRHVDMGLDAGRLAPVMRAALAAARTRLGGGGRSLAPAVILGLTLRAEPGVSAVWMAQLEAQVDAALTPLDTAAPHGWIGVLEDALGSWGLKPSVQWRSEAADGVARRAGAPGRGSALRCVSATLEGHGRWLVRTTTYERQTPARIEADRPLRRALRGGDAQRDTVTSSQAVVERVRRWRRSGASSPLSLDVSAMASLEPAPDGGVMAGPAARLSDIETALRAQGRTLGFAITRDRDTRLLDLLFDTRRWRHAAVRRSAHGVGLDPAGAVLRVQGVDDRARAGELVRWTSLTGGASAVPTEIHVLGWRRSALQSCADWRCVGAPEVLLAQAHALTRKTPHLLRLALRVSDGQGELWIRTGGRTPGSIRAVDHLRSTLPDARRGPAAAWPWPAPGGSLRALRDTLPPGATWVSRFSRGEAVALVRTEDERLADGLTEVSL